jgi:hypothetical protein
MHRDLIEHVVATSDPTLRAVFAEDAAALLGLVIATAGLAALQVTGSAVPDAVGSILIGVLLTVVAGVLINRNRRFLVGEEADPEVRAAVLQALLDLPEVARVTYLQLEVVGPRTLSVIGDVDLTGDDAESHVAVRLRAGGQAHRLPGGGRRGSEPLRSRRAHTGHLTGVGARRRAAARCERWGVPQLVCWSGLPAAGPRARARSGSPSGPPA